MFDEDYTPGMDPENYFKDFFEHKVKTLWPKNWMNARDLYKESRNVHNHLT
jgi:ubinuclein